MLKILSVVALMALCTVVTEAKPADRAVKRVTPVSTSKEKAPPKLSAAKLAKIAGDWKSIYLGGGILRINADATYDLIGRFNYQKNNEPKPDMKGTITFKGVENVHGTRREVYFFSVLGDMCLFEDSPELGLRFYNYSGVRPDVYHKMPK